jgi:hypothetical protein
MLKILNPKLQIQRDCQMKGKQILIPVTLIDEYFSLESNVHSLNSRELWEKVPEQLEQLCSHKSEKYNKTEKSICVSYKVETFDFVIFDEKTKEKTKYEGDEQYTVTYNITYCDESKWKHDGIKKHELPWKFVLHRGLQLVASVFYNFLYFI